MPERACTAASGKLPPNTDIERTSSRSSDPSASSRAPSSEIRLGGTSSSPSSPASTSAPSRSTRTPRSASARTVSIAYRGTPSACEMILRLAVIGSVATASISSSIAPSPRGSSDIAVAPRCRAAQPGRRSDSSGLASVRMKIRWCADQSRRYSTKSSNPSSAACMSSNTITTGSSSAIRSKNRRQPANSSSRPAPPSATPSRTPSRAETNSRSPGSPTHCSRPARSFRSVSSNCASSGIPRRCRTISASAP